MSLAQLQEVPSENMILLTGPPGAGKSTFCEQVILQSLAMDRPIIYVTTECGPSDAACMHASFFNGFFSAVKNQHVKETKCIAMGDPYCEWEFR